MSRRASHQARHRRTLSEAISREYFKLPNAVADVLMPLVLPSHFNGFICIWRASVGYNHSEFSLSLSDLARQTGTSRDTACSILRFWEQTGLFRRTGRIDQRGASIFQLAPMEDILSGLNRLVDKSRQTDFSATAGRKKRLPLVGWFDHYKDNDQKQVNIYTQADVPLSSEPLQSGSPATGGTSIPDPNHWDLVKSELRKTVNSRTYDTWITPTRLALALNGTLHVHVPTREWSDRLEQLRAQIEEAIKRLNLPFSDVTFEPMQSD